MTSRKKPGVAFWATVVVVVALVAYPLSFGPACWISSRTGEGAQHIGLIYRPMTRFLTDGIIYSGAGIKSTTAEGPLNTWATMFAASRWKWRLTMSRKNPDANWQWSDRCFWYEPE